MSVLQRYRPPVLVGGLTSSAIQAAIDSSVPGDEVVFPNGVYSISSTVVLKPNRRYTSTHPSNGSRTSPTSSTTALGGAILQQAAAANLDAMLVAEAYDSTTATQLDAPIEVDHLIIDGNKSAQTAGAGHGLVMANFRGNAHDLNIINPRGAGLILTDERRNGGDLAGPGFECRLDRVLVDAPGMHGIWIRNGAGASAVSDGFLRDCVVGFSGMDGIHLETSVGWEISGCHVYATGHNHITTRGAHATRIHDNYLESFGRVTGSGSIAYAAGTTYDRYAPVLSGGVAYYSLIDSNLGNTPSSSPTAWQPLLVAAYVGLLMFLTGGTRPSFVHDNVVANNSINQQGFAYRAFNVHTDASNVATVLFHDNCVSQEAVSGSSVYTAYRLNRASGTLRVWGRNNKILGTVGTTWNVDATVDLGTVATVAAGAQTQSIASTSPTDHAGAVSATAVAVPAAGAVAVVTFGSGLGRAPAAVVITPTTAAAAAAGLYVSAKSATAFTVSSSVAAVGDAVLGFDYAVTSQG